MIIDPELTEQLKRVLSALEPLLPRPVPKHGLDLAWNQEAAAEAVLWSQRKGDRSGRISWQFANDWVGRNAMGRTC